MPRLLRNNDYLRSIQSDNLLQIIESNQQIRLEVEQSAQEEMKSYLAQRYLVDKIFTDTTEFSFSATYYGKNLIEYTADAWDISTTYVINDRVVYEDKLYKCTTGCKGVKPTVIANWTYLCDDKSLYYAKTPYAEYSNTTEYVTGNQVWYNDISYTAKTDTVGNLPTDTNYWTAGSTYSFSGYYPENTTYWTKGDNRSYLIVQYLIDIVLYHLHARINPRNIPELRIIRYDGNSPMQTGGAIAWLKRVGKGEITAELPSIIPTQGLSIRYGSNDKNVNVF